MRAVDHPRSRTLPDLLDEIARRDPAREFIVGGRDRLSYAETRARARQLAKGLPRLGVKRGDKIALLMSNRPPCVRGERSLVARPALLAERRHAFREVRARPHPVAQRLVQGLAC